MRAGHAEELRQLKARLNAELTEAVRREAVRTAPRAPPLPGDAVLVPFTAPL
ncbi:MAG: hypothetical protein IT380_15065 [Myxococcales bacterium]|nr:hypothetical protein [Myxococcales bacterium]